MLFAGDPGFQNLGFVVEQVTVSDYQIGEHSGLNLANGGCHVQQASGCGGDGRQSLFATKPAVDGDTHLLQKVADIFQPVCGQTKINAGSGQLRGILWSEVPVQQIAKTCVSCRVRCFNVRFLGKIDRHQDRSPRRCDGI